MRIKAGSRKLLQQLHVASVDGCNVILKDCIIFWVQSHDVRPLLSDYVTGGFSVVGKQEYQCICLFVSPKQNKTKKKITKAGIEAYG